MQHILLATYSYYPYHWGGSEVYVQGLAKRLIADGYKVKILASVPEVGLKDCDLVYNDEYLQIGIYEHKGVEVIGCVLDPSREEIYSRYNPNWEI